MIGAGFDIDEAISLHEPEGPVHEITWSKAQGARGTLPRTKAYALCRLDALTEKLALATGVVALAETERAAESKAPVGLALLAHCFLRQRTDRADGVGMCS